jgi:peptidoglycan hydrolase FlgJ
MAAPITDVRTYGDFAGLEALKKSAHGNDPAAIREVARQFESLFARMVIKSMRDAIGRDPIFGSDQEETYQGMYDDQLSLELTRGHGLGLADMLVRQLQRRTASASGSQASSAQASSPQASPGTGATRDPSRSAPLPPASQAERTSFIREVWPQAQQAGAELGVAPASLVAQAALETDWGRSVPRDGSGRSSQNLFGVKASHAWSGQRVSAVTQEFQGANQQSGIPAGSAASARPTVAEFRAYSSRGESFQDYVALLRRDPRYAAALNTGADVNAFATALQRGGYATDPEYARKVSAVAESVTSALAGQAMPRAVALAGQPPTAPALEPASREAALKFADATPMTVATDRL